MIKKCKFQLTKKYYCMLRILLLLLMPIHSQLINNNNTNNSNNTAASKEKLSFFNFNLTHLKYSNNKNKTYESLLSTTSSIAKSIAPLTDQNLTHNLNNKIEQIPRNIIPSQSDLYQLKITDTQPEETSTTTFITTTSTTTITTTKRIEYDPFIIDFKLFDVSYDKKKRLIMIDFLIQTNKSNININQNNANYYGPNGVLASLDSKCTNKYNQSWSKYVNGIYVNTSIYTSRLSVNTRQLEPPFSGSLIKCIAVVSNSYNNVNQNFTQSILLLIDPSPATNLAMKSLNDTAIELKWSNPLHVYDLIDIQCYLNEQIKLPLSIGTISTINSDNSKPFITSINRTIYNTEQEGSLSTGLSQYLVLTNLIPGASYNCTITTKRRNENLFAQVTSLTAYQNTKLSKPILVDNQVKINDDNSIEVNIIPPMGYYDYFVVELKESITRANFKKEDLVLQPFLILNQTLEQTRINSLTGQHVLNLKLNNPIVIRPGTKYDIWTKVVRAYNQLDNIKLGSTFIIRPSRPSNLAIYAKSNHQINITWLNTLDNEISSTNIFLIEIFELNERMSLFNSTILFNKTWYHTSNIIREKTYFISIKKCAKLSTECDTLSDSLNQTYNLNSSHQVNDFEIKYRKNSNPASFLNFTTLDLDWQLNGSNICDLSQFKIYYYNKNLSINEECFTPNLKICPNNNYESISNRNNTLCSSIGGMECTQNSKTSNIIKCKYIISNLNFNTVYQFRISPVSKSGTHEWSSTIQSTIRTETSIPNIQLKPKSSLNINLKLPTSTLFSFIQPSVDQTKGAVVKSYLYMVKLNKNESNNQTKIDNINDTLIPSSFYLKSTSDQAFLRQLIELTNQCSNDTVDLIEQPCLLKSYESNEIDLNEERLVFVGKLLNNMDSFLDNLNLTQYTFDILNYENITFDYIESFTLYQVFYIFQIETIESFSLEIKKRSTDNEKTYLYYSTLASDPIQTKKYLPVSTIASLISRDGLALWLIISISVVSSIILILVILGIIGLLFRYKPSKFHKAAQMVSASNGQHPRLHNLSSLGGPSHQSLSINRCGTNKFMEYLNSKSDDYLAGISNDNFIVPGEFSRQQMTNIWLVKHANGDLILDEEYRNLPDYRDMKTSYASQLIKNEVKNRFLDIKAYDESRVLLDVPVTSNNTNTKNTSSQNSVAEKSILTASSMSTSTTSSNNSSQDIEMQNQSACGYVLTDYINANFIQGYSHEKKFIATQGPKRETIVDFWRMIFQYRITAIVMLTKLVEKGVERCTQYWPDKLNITEQYGDFEVTMKDQQRCGDYIKRTFDLVNLNFSQLAATSAHTTITNVSCSTPGTLSINNRRILTVTQYYYPEWPDKDTPSTDPISILHLIRDVNLNHLAYQYPIVVHCSAGVGRTGTYITLDAMMEKIDLEGKIDIFGFISKIRERRQYLVQTSKQYVFIHEALYEYCLYSFTDIEIGNLPGHYKYLKEMPSAQSNKTRLQIEYEKLSNAFAPNSQAREAFSNDNKSRNRYLNTICYDENRIKLSSLNGSSYINATKIKGYELPNELIITQDPMKNTVFEFWKMIVECECSVIVALNKDFELETESVYWPTLEEPVRVSEVDDLKYVIELIKPVNKTNDDDKHQFLFTKREFEITEFKYSSTTKTKITHFLFNEPWAEDRAPKSRRSFLDLILQVQKTVSAANFENSRIAVHAYGGGSNCSVFCSLVILLNQFKNDQHVDVCRTVKTLKTQRPHMIETYEQYEFLYDCLLDFVEIFSVYNQSSISLEISFNESIYRKSPLKKLPLNK